MATRGMSEFVQNGTAYTVNDPNIADEFDSTQANDDKDYVYHDGDLHQFITGHSEGSWNAAYVNKVKLGKQVERARKIAVSDARSLGGRADLKQYLYKEKTYISDDGSFVDNDTIDAYYIPVQENDIIYLTTKDGASSIWESIGAGLRALVRQNGTIFSLSNNNTNVGFCNSTSKDEIIVIGRAGVRDLFINIRRERVDNAALYINHYGFGDYRTTGAIGEDNTIKSVRADNTMPGGYIYMLTGGASNRFTFMYQDTNAAPKTLYIKVKAGQKIISDRVSSGYSTIGVFNSYDDSVVETFGVNYTVPKDGFCCIFRASSDLNNVDVYPSEPIRIQYSSIVDPPGGTQLLLYGKKVVTLGDSISNLGDEGWQPMIKNLIGGTWVACARGSTPLSGSTNEYAFWKDVRLNAVKAENPDILTILGGANDLTQNPVIGDESNLEDKDTDTFIGAYSYIINNLLTWKPSLKIIIMSTTWAHNDGADYSDTVTYGDFAAACKTVAEYYHLPYVDLYNQSGFNKYTLNSSPYNIYSSDHIHPNTLGCKIIASMVIEKIKEVFGVT